MRFLDIVMPETMNDDGTEERLISEGEFVYNIIRN